MMEVFSIQPRFRIYTSPATYFSIFKDLVIGNIFNGNDCQKLENKIQDFFNIPHSICMPQARVAIYLAIKATIKAGQNVILSPYTIADVINMVICAGGIPVFADIERETCNIDPKEIEKLIEANTGAVLITHLQGLSCDMDKIVEICKTKHIPLIEDASQAFGCRYKGKMVGTFGDIGINSFGMYKNLISFYGGILTTPNKSLWETIQTEIKTFPYMEKGFLFKKIFKGLSTDLATSAPLFQMLVYWIFRFGYLNDIKFLNRMVESELDLSRKHQIPEAYLRQMTPLQARLALLKLENVDRDNAIRIRYAQIYHEGLHDLPDLILPPLRTDGSHIYTYYPIQFRERRKLQKWMIANYRDIAIQHLKNCADLPAFSDFYKDCPKARITANEVILLSTYPRYSEAEVRKNVEVIRKFFLA